MEFGKLPAGVDLIVMRQEKVSAKKVADIAAKVIAARASAPVLSVPVAPADALAALNSALSDAAILAITYRNTIEFSSQICLEFAAEEGVNFELSDPLHAAHAALKNVLTSHIISSDHKTQVAAALRDAVACVNSLIGTRSEILRSHTSCTQQLEAKKQHALQTGDIPLAKNMISQLQQQESEGALRLQDVDDMISKLSVLVSRAQDLLDLACRRPAWPKHEALLRFDLPLQRFTTQSIFPKKWFMRFFCMRGRRLYYSSGKKYPESREGALSFMRSNPAPDGRYCVDLTGEYALLMYIARDGVTLLRRLLCRCMQRARRRAVVCI